jgi:hypothetical protein
MSKRRSKRRLSQEDAELLKLAFSSPSDINNSQLHLSDLPCEKNISERSGFLSSYELIQSEKNDDVLPPHNPPKPPKPFITSFPQSTTSSVKEVHK